MSKEEHTGYYSDHVERLDEVHALYHRRSMYEIDTWIYDTKEDLENFIFNWIDLDPHATGQEYFLQMANRWYAIAHLVRELGWEY